MVHLDNEARHKRVMKMKNIIILLIFPSLFVGCGNEKSAEDQKKLLQRLEEAESKLQTLERQATSRPAQMPQPQPPR